ncbi:MAG: S8 family serine peptidase [Cyclobacteriaceae bacterium]
MEKFYRQFKCKIFAAAIVVLLIFSFPSFAQETLEGVARIKVSENLASQLDKRSFSVNSTGEVVTGVISLDQLNRQLKVRRFTRVFPHAGKNEARHRKYGLHLWYEVRMDKSIAVSQLIQSYQSEKQILKAEPVYKKAIVGSGAINFGPRFNTEKENALPLPNASNDPMLPAQWHYNNTGQTGGTPGADIRLFDAWKIETGKNSVVVAVTDGGVQTDHPDLRANMWVNQSEIAGNHVDDDNNGYIDDIHGYNFVKKDSVISPDSHGTHIAGTIAAVSNNGVGVAGVAGGSGKNDGVKLMSCAVFQTDSEPGGFAEAYVYSADNGAVISQNSWGYTLPGIYEQVVLDAIDYFIAQAGKNENGFQTGPMNGGLVIFSAGNSNEEANYYPAFYEPVLAVASSTHKDIRAQYSNYGTWIDITAPGGETYQSEQEGVFSTLPGNQYGSFMGTSMACPHVTGVAGLVISKFGKTGFRPEALRERLRNSVNNIDTINPLFAGKLGSGRINAAMALGQNDQTPPLPIDDLAVAGNEIGQITLTWTSPQDGSNFVAAYDVRYSTAPITGENFSSATAPTGIPAPKPPGTTETFTIKNLSGGIIFYFAVRSIDFEGNSSPISNVVSETSALTPTIVVNPPSLTENLATAERSTLALTIKNEGQGPLTFTILESADDDPFATTTPLEGVISPGNEQIITVTFDAAELLAGTYQQDLVIENNDPEKNNVVVPLTLQVTNNGAPIASVEPVTIDFKSVRTGTTLSRTVIVSNAGSDALVITKALSNNPAFKADFTTPVNIQAFASTQLSISFSPVGLGPSTGMISIHTNDPVNEILEVAVQGEGLQEVPVVASPDSFNETLATGTTVTRTMVLQNNGSQERAFRVEVLNNGLANSENSVSARSPQGRMAMVDDSTRTRQVRMREKHTTRLAAKSANQKALVTAIAMQEGVNKSDNTQGRKSTSAALEAKQYATGFEDFTPGPVVDQQGWISTQGWTISAENADKGTQHFRGTSQVSGTGEKFALSPYLFEHEEYYPAYTTTTMRLNLDNARGTTWEVVPQDPRSYIATRIRFNANGSIEAFVIDNDYEFHWKKVPVTTPSGYFDLAIEYNNWGSDTSGFPTYYLFINNQHVFSGTGLGSGIGQVAIVSPMEISGPVFDMDEFNLFGEEYIPAFVKPAPKEGTVPARGSVDISLQFDASIMKFGTYKSDVVVHLDETDSLLVPATLTVTGQGSLIRDVHYVFMELGKGETGRIDMTLTNTGGQPIQYALDLERDLAGLTINPRTGTIPIRGSAVVAIEFQGDPGIYENKIILSTDLEDYTSEEIPVEIVVFDSGAIFIAPDEVQYDIPAGEISTRNIQVRNNGENTVSYATEVSYYQPWISVDPSNATLSDQPLDVTLTFDAREVSAGIQKSLITFKTNDLNLRSHRMLVTLNVSPDTVGSSEIVREEWTGIPGKEISSIPLDSPPSSTSVLKKFESPRNTGDNYGSRIRGYIRAPLEGYYTFWISSNDHSELWLSPDEDPQFKEKIAFVTGYANPLQWNKFPTQMSEAIYLEANRKYYIEALHKEGVGTDHLAVGWRLPDETLERPMPGLRLIPYGQEETNEPPQISLTTPIEGEIFSSPATIEIKAQAEDSVGSIVKVEFYNGVTKLNTDISAPYVFSWKNVAAGNYTLIAKATDNLGATDTAAVNVVVTADQPCTGAGKIEREVWDSITGVKVSLIPVNSTPSSTSELTSFESPVNVGDNYGSRVRGYICVPATGGYTFWIASDDYSELWLSTDESPANKTKISSVTGATRSREWTKYASQQSGVINLQGGKRYYIEALHKENKGYDNLAVGWQLPNGTQERPIPGTRLIPFHALENNDPVVIITSPEDGQIFSTPTSVDISATASDSDGNVTKVEFYNGTIKLGEDATAPYAYTWNNISAGNYSLMAKAIDDDGATHTDSVDIVVTSACAGAGKIEREVWYGITGVSVSLIPVNSTPSSISELTIFESPVNVGDNYGARIRGYICAPATGGYTFWIASDDYSDLWLSSDENPANKIKIAFVIGATRSREWTKYSSQQSAVISLQGGKRYYIEALHKENKGYDNLAVGWQLPDGTFERPITGNRISPVEGSTMTGAGRAFVSKASEEGPVRIQVYPNPVKGDKLNVAFENLSQGNTINCIEIRQITGLMVYTNTLNCSDGCNSEIFVNENFPPGLYILLVMVNGKMFIEKLIIP